MTSYLIIKYIHILSSVIMVGTGFGSALYVFCSNHFGDLRTQHFTNRMVVHLDWYLTLPTVIIQPLSGLWLMQHIGWQWNTPWLLNVYVIYAVVGMAWLPVVWLQIKMKQLTDYAHLHNLIVDKKYQVYRRWWEGLGYIGFSGAIALFYLMVTKTPLFNL